MIKQNQQLSEQLKAFDFKNVFLSRGWNPPVRRPFLLNIKDREVTCTPIAEQGGWTVLEITAAGDEVAITSPGERAWREMLDKAVTDQIHHHILIFINAERTEAVWQFSTTIGGKRLRRERRLNATTPTAPLLALLHGMEIPFELLDGDGEMPVTTMNDRMAQIGVYADKVSKKFYEQLAKKRKGFELFLAWVDAEKDRSWYVTALLNRLMFIYFIQHKGLMKGDQAYLRHRLDDCITHGYNFYRDFFLPLCFFGFAKPWGERKKYGGHFDGIPYLNGGLFMPHKVELDHGITPEAVEGGTLPPEITISNEQFVIWFDFFDSYRWTLDEENIEHEGHINPDILGYIFEKYINQKQMGAYYTKEDITGYICRNTIIPRLFDMLTEKMNGKGDQLKKFILHPSAFSLDNYIYPAVKTQEHLPTETEREYFARQQRYEAIQQDFEDGKITTINDIITYNFDIERLALDFIAGIQDAEVLRDFYFQGLRKITILDPTCGSGAFLFAALKILSPLYELCVRKMHAFYAKETGEQIELKWGEANYFSSLILHSSSFIDTPDDGRQAILEQFGAELTSIREHENVKYFIYKRIIVDNLFGVDIMAEAVEICKLRLFLKLIAHAEQVPGKDNLGIEPLPDVDFNILCGNTLVGFATHEEARQAVLGKGQTSLQFDDTMERIEEKARAVDSLATVFRQAQIARNSHAAPEQKATLETALRGLEHELNGYLARQYGISSQESKAYMKWLGSHQPFHWYVEFFGTITAGGFDVIVGNPPYVEKRTVQSQYCLLCYETDSTNNLYAYVSERAQIIQSNSGRFGFIVPLSSMATDKFEPLQVYLTRQGSMWLSNFDDRPSRLFDGLEHIQLTIMLIAHEEKINRHNIFVTPCYKWSSVERVNLFSQLWYAHLYKTYMTGSIPKVGSQIEVNILDKIWSTTTNIGAHCSSTGQHIVYYTRKVHAFLNILDFVPEIRDSTGKRRDPSEQKTLSFSSKQLADAALCGLNSTLFRWFLTVFSDCRNLNRREVLYFPLNLSVLVATKSDQLTRLAETLSKSLLDTSEIRQMNFGGELLQVQCIIPKHSKLIIDEIDRVIAQHYCFTDEELDFIINYDIKYRMGRDAEGNCEVINPKLYER